MSDEEFGPWIEHDGTGCPVPNGTIVIARYRGGFDICAKVTANGRVAHLNPWVHREGDLGIIRYRVKKPRGLTILEGLLENLPTPTDRVPA